MNYPRTLSSFLGMASTAHLASDEAPEDVTRTSVICAIRKGGNIDSLMTTIKYFSSLRREDSSSLSANQHQLPKGAIREVFKCAPAGISTAQFDSDGDAPQHLSVTRLWVIILTKAFRRSTKSLCFVRARIRIAVSAGSPIGRRLL